MDLRHLIDRVLLQDTKKLTGREREIMSEVLHHLREIERRKLFADLGYSSMFAYCTQELKYSPDQAQRRICASRLLATLPEIEKKLDDGSLNLAILGMANSFFNQKNLDMDEKWEVLEQISNKSKRDVEKMLAPDSLHAPGNEAERKISKTQTKVTLILQDSVVEKLKALQALLSHTKKHDLPELIDFLASKELAKREKSAATNRVPKSKPQGTAVVGRTIPSAVKKELWSKAKGQCQHPLCSSKHFLQIHHVIPYSEGGAHIIENLKLLCHAHHSREHWQA
jgi:hypothetical protein